MGALETYERIGRLNEKYISAFCSEANDARVSLISSFAGDDATQDAGELIELAAKAAIRAAKISISDAHLPVDSRFYNVFPGEHYRILAGLVELLEPKRIVEIGTYTGMSSRIFLDYSPVDSKLHTFDILDWRQFDTHLSNADFKSGKIVQRLCDLSVKSSFQDSFSLLNDADIIFCDGPKDGAFEYKLLNLMSACQFSQKKRFLLLDDIRLINMTPLWRSVSSPKFDLTSLGHWSGTGIVDICGGLRLRKKYNVN